MKCCELTAKYTMFTFNLLVFIAGFILLIVGILDRMKFSAFRNVLPEDYQQIGLAPVLTITVGILAIIVSFFGCFGAQREISRFLTVFVILVAIILFLQIVIAVVALIGIGTSSLEAKSESTLKGMFDKYHTDQTSASKDMVDLIQREMECCGVTGPSYWTSTGSAIPESCTDKHTQVPYENGCSKQCADYTYKYVRTIGITIMTITVIEILGMLLAICLANVYKNDSGKSNPKNITKQVKRNHQR